MAVNGIGDFVTSLKETRRLAAQIVIEIKGEAAGHPFRGNQWSGGRGGSASSTNSGVSPDGKTYYRGGYGRESNYATDDPDIADEYARRAAIEATGKHPENVEGKIVSKVIYAPKKEANFSSLPSSVTPDEFLMTYKPLVNDKTWGYDEGGKLARNMGYKRGDEYIQTWKYFENKDILNALSAHGYDGIRFQDQSRGNQHEAVRTIGEPPKKVE